MNEKIQLIDDKVQSVLLPHIGEHCDQTRMDLIKHGLKEHGFDHVTWTLNEGRHSFTIRTNLDGTAVDLTYKVTF